MYLYYLQTSFNLSPCMADYFLLASASFFLILDI